MAVVEVFGREWPRPITSPSLYHPRQLADKLQERFSSGQATGRIGQRRLEHVVCQ